MATDIYGNLPIYYVSPNLERLHWFLSFKYTYIGINTKNNQGYTLLWFMNERDKNFCLTSYILLLLGINFDSSNNKNETFVFPGYTLHCKLNHCCPIMKYFKIAKTLNLSIVRNIFPDGYNFDEIFSQQISGIDSEINM